MVALWSPSADTTFVWRCGPEGVCEVSDVVIWFRLRFALPGWQLNVNGPQ